MKEARIYFKAGKGRDGYFDCADLCAQTEIAIELHEDNFGGTAIAAFGFDNAPGHQKRADDALSACHMPKNAKIWNGKHGKCKMRPGKLPNGDSQDFYFPEDHLTMPGWFKGMSLILAERGFNEDATPRAQCKGFKCADPKAACCCRRILFISRTSRTRNQLCLSLLNLTATL